MRVLNKSTMMVAVLLALSACQGDEKPAKVQASTPQVPVSQPSQPAQPAPPVVQAESVKSEASALPTSKKEAVPTRDSRLRAAVQARMQQAKAEAAARQQMGMQFAVAMKSEAVKKAAEKAAEKANLNIPEGDVGRGKKLAKKCVVCHDFGRRNKMGPGLIEVFNRQAGTFAGYRYTYAAFIAEGKAWRWDTAHLAAWLCDSKAAVRVFTGNAAAKTRMSAQRICDAGKQRDIIAYLKTL
ncbi:MAG: c-type cytochrome [Mariprofundaceae bacterium]|nr:c-type cytochrome [Mariprofundaceae bacterium]